MNIEIHAGPDEWGRSAYTVSYDDDSPPWCSTCGGTVERIGFLVACSGYPLATPARPSCGRVGPTMTRGQGFFAPLPGWAQEDTRLRPESNGTQ